MCKSLSLLVLLVEMTLASSTYADPVYNPLNGHYYEAVDAAEITWPAAVVEAAKRSIPTPGGFATGHLATVTSAEENSFLLSHFPAGELRWLGGYQDHRAPGYSEPSGGWRWITDEPWNYTNWSSGEPNNSYQGGELGEDYLETWTGATEWNDGAGVGHLAGRRGYFVEYEISAVACPADLTHDGQVDDSDFVVFVEAYNALLCE